MKLFLRKKNAQQKSKKQPKHGGKGRIRQICMIFVGGLGATLVLFGCLKVRDPDWLPINRVSIVGSYDQVDKQALQQAITPRVSRSFWLVNVGEIKSEVEKLPWVSQVTVKKRWPDRVIVDIQQYQAVTRWNDDGLISKTEKVFYPTRTVSHRLPSLYGPEGSHKEVMAGYYEMQRTLHPLGVNIKSLRVDKRHAWVVELENDIRLLLGQDHHQQRLKRFARAYGQVADFREADIGSVDLRYNNAMAVRWKSETIFGLGKAKNRI